MPDFIFYIPLRLSDYSQDQLGSHQSVAFKNYMRIRQDSRHTENMMKPFCWWNRVKTPIS